MFTKVPSSKSRIEFFSVDKKICSRKGSHASKIRLTKSRNSNISRLALRLSGPIHCSQVLRREWRCSWSSAHMWSSNYTWVIKKFIVYWRLILEIWRYHFALPYTYESYYPCCPTHCLYFYGTKCRYILKWKNRVDWHIMAIHSLDKGSQTFELKSHKATTRHVAT